MYLFWTKKSSIFSFRVNDTLTSILSALHPFLTLPNDDLKREGGSRTFLSFSSDLIKGAKRYVPFFQLEAMFSKAPKWYLFCRWK